MNLVFKRSPYIRFRAFVDFGRPIIVTVFVLLSFTAGAQPQSKVPGLETLYRELRNLDIDVGANQVFKLANGVGLKIGYNFQAGPAYYGSKYQRVDEWNLGFNTNIMQSLAPKSSITAGIDPRITVRFYQFFDSLKDAVLPKHIYGTSKFPDKAENILDNLKPGDMIHLEGHLKFHLGAHHLYKSALDQVGFTPSIGKSLHGTFRLFVFRGEGARVRVRLGVIRSSPSFLKFNVGLLDVISIGSDFVNKTVENILRLDRLAGLDISRFHQELFVADYILDLKDQRAIELLNGLIFESEKDLEALFKSANPLLSDRTLSDQLNESLKPFNEATSDEKGALDPYITNTFYGSNFADGDDFKTQLGMSAVIRKAAQTTRQENKLVRVGFETNRKRNTEYFLFPSWRKVDRNSALFTTTDERAVKSANVIYRADQNHKIIGFESFGIHTEDRDKRFSRNDFIKRMSRFRLLLPNVVYRDLEQKFVDSGWLDNFKVKKNVRIRARYFFEEKGLQALENTSKDVLAAAFAKAINEEDRNSEDHFQVFAGPNPDAMDRASKCNPRILDRIGIEIHHGEIGTLANEHCGDVEYVAQQLAEVLNSKNSAEKRHHIFSALTEVPLFRDLGIGVLFSLIPDALVQDVAYVNVTIHAKDLRTPILFEYGKNDNELFHNFLFEVVTSTADEQPDLRLPGTVESFTTRVIK